MYSYTYRANNAIPCRFVLFSYFLYDSQRNTFRCKEQTRCLSCCLETRGIRPDFFHNCQTCGLVKTQRECICLCLHHRVVTRLKISKEGCIFNSKGNILLIWYDNTLDVLRYYCSDILISKVLRYCCIKML